MTKTLEELGLKEIKRSDDTGIGLYLIGGRRVASAHKMLRAKGGVVQHSFHIDILLGPDLSDEQEAYLLDWKKQQIMFA